MSQACTLTHLFHSCNGFRFAFLNQFMAAAALHKLGLSWNIYLLAHFTTRQKIRSSVINGCHQQYSGGLVGIVALYEFASSYHMFDIVAPLSYIYRPLKILHLQLTSTSITLGYKKAFCKLSMFF